MADSQEELQRRLLEACAKAGKEHYVLRLYVAGNTPKSLRAVTNLQRICDTHLAGRVELEVIDIYQNVDQVVQDEHVVAAPMLVKTLPPPLRRLVGDLSDEGRVLVALDLAQEDDEDDEQSPQS